MQRIEIDVFGGLPMTHTGKRYILVACNTYTKYMQAWPMRSQTLRKQEWPCIVIGLQCMERLNAFTQIRVATSKACCFESWPH